MTTPPEQRLLADVLYDDAHDARREALRARCLGEIRAGALPARALLDDVLADDGYLAFRDGLEASLRGRVSPTRRTRWIALASVAAILAVALALGRFDRREPAPEPVPEPPAVVTVAEAPRATPPSRRAARRRTASRVHTTSVRRVRSKRAGVRVESRGGRRRPPKAIARRVQSARGRASTLLSDERLLALLPRCSLVRRGASWQLHFLDPADEARIVHGPPAP